MKKRKKVVLKIIIIVLTVLISLFLIRAVNPSEIDDITPGIPCPELEKYNPDVLYVIPNYQEHPLSFYPEWCDYILSLNKTLALHGLNHTYREFLYQEITQENLQSGIYEFETCFGYSPEIFKPPQLKINKENKDLIEKNNLKLQGIFNQITHKVYHCEDSDNIPNKIIRIF